MTLSDRDSWTRPGTYAVAPGVHRIVCPLPHDGLRAVNVYAIEDGPGVALVDTGWNDPAIVQAIEAALGSLGRSVADLTAILATHSHYDHYALAGRLRARSGAPVMLGEHELTNLRVALDPAQFETERRFRRDFLIDNGAQALVDEIEPAQETFERVSGGGPWEAPDRTFAAGERVTLASGRELEAVFSPGHTRGHLMYLDREAGVLFGGDHALPLITPSLGFEAYPDGKALERFLASLRACRDLPAELVLPGHGPVYEDLVGRMDELLEHHARRLAACADVLETLGASTAYAVARRLTWTRHERPFAGLDRFNRMLATAETITHLELLADHGRTTRLEGLPRCYA